MEFGVAACGAGNKYPGTVCLDYMGPMGLACMIDKMNTQPDTPLLKGTRDYVIRWC